MDAPSAPRTVDMLGLANSMDTSIRPYTCDDGSRAAVIRLGDAQTRAVSDALRALAEQFDAAERYEAFLQPYVDFVIGEQAYRAAVAAVRARLEPQTPARLSRLDCGVF